MKRWKLTYFWDADPIAVTSQPPGYPSLGVSFVYDASGRLVRAIHEVTFPPRELPEAVVAASQAILRPLWEVLSFTRGVAVPHGSPRVEEVVDPGNTFRVAIGAAASCVVVSPATIPTEGLVTAASLPLLAELHIANRASGETDPTHALRDYYIILEGIHGKAPAGEVLSVKHARDFVSHPTLDRKGVRDFLLSELGTPTDRFNPHNPDHIRLVAKWRSVARRLVEDELRRQLP